MDVAHLEQALLDLQIPPFASKTLCEGIPTRQLSLIKALTPLMEVLDHVDIPQDSY